MNRATIALLLLFLAAPFIAAAKAPALFDGGRSLLLASSSPENRYAAGGSVAVSGETGGDLTAVGGSVVVAAPVALDALLIGGSVDQQAPVKGDVRAAGGTLAFDNPIGGDLAAIGASVSARGTVHGSLFVVAGSATLVGGADGPVSVYANSAVIGGDYAGDVMVIASGRVSVAKGTHIAGTLSYESPEAASIPPDAHIGLVRYEGSSPLPSVGETRTLAALGVGIFLFARVLGTLILAGLLAGLFPYLAEEVAARAYEGRARGILLTTLLGFAAVAATPVLLVLLSLTFIGLGLALLLFIAYALLLLLSFTYAGILLGALLARRLARRSVVYWRDGVLGMLVLTFIWFVPVVGTATVALLIFFAAGALLLRFFHGAFPHEEETPELL